MNDDIRFYSLLKHRMQLHLHQQPLTIFAFGFCRWHPAGVIQHGIEEGGKQALLVQRHLLPLWHPGVPRRHLLSSHARHQPATEQLDYLPLHVHDQWWQISATLVSMGMGVCMDSFSIKILWISIIKFPLILTTTTNGLRDNVLEEGRNGLR